MLFAMVVRYLKLLKFGWLVLWNVLLAIAYAVAAGFAVYAVYQVGWPAALVLALAAVVRWLISRPSALLGLVIGWRMGRR